MFEKIVAVEPVNLTPDARKRLASYARKTVFYDTPPADGEEMARRIGQADAVLISYTSNLGQETLRRCPNLRYIGMCCSLYDEKSANVDIAAAQTQGITVTGVRDYGDQGVAEYAVSELARYLHGFGEKQWGAQPEEITRLNIGIIGLGALGGHIARAFQYFGAQVCYFSRTRKDREGFLYLPLETLLQRTDVVFTCLTKNTVLLHEAEFRKFGNHKVLFNVGIGPNFDVPALEHWLADGRNEFFCDSLAALGDARLLTHPHVNCVQKASGTTGQAKCRLSRMVLEHMETYLRSRDV